ncbi:MAG: hypothetical protein NTX64_14000 [Elusimicrobia bacterium]|nr:hypothetical protein [Elusimicrobiota bacterium]
MTLGNMLAVRFYFGETLRANGFVRNHIACLGAAASVLQAWAARAWLEEGVIRAFLDRVGLAASGFILILLTSTYFTRPDLESISSARFLVSGLLAFIAARRFKRAARRPDPEEAPYVRLWEGAYHYGVTTALWCVALLLPWFRSPNAAFPALGLPVLYFYARAELGGAPRVGTALPYRDTAAALSFFLLVLYAFRGAFQAVLFPQAPLGLEHYHFNAPFVLLLSFVMLRLHALGGTPWLAYYAGLAMMVGSYMGLTSLPGLSPFSSPIAAAWCAVALGHFWLLVSFQDSPVKSFLQGFGAIDETKWLAWRDAWGAFLLISTQAALVWGLLHHASAPLLVAPLLLGGASLAAHQSLIRRSAALHALALLELLLAAHAGFFVQSWLPFHAAVWAVLAVWGALLAWAEADGQGLAAQTMAPASTLLLLIALAHVFYHGPSSAAGLGAFAAAAALLSLTPRASREARSVDESACAALLAASPVWLVFFAAAGTGGAWPALTTAAALFAVGAAARWLERHVASRLSETGRPRAFHQTLRLLEARGDGIQMFLLYVVTLSLLRVQFAHYATAFEPRELALLLALYGGLAAAWRTEARLRRATAPYLLLEVCVLAFLAAARRQLMLSWNYWNYEFDVWASLLASCALAGARQALPEEASEARLPVAGALLALPAAALAWVYWRGLGTDAALLVVGLNSLIFSFLGKDDRDSPYRLVAVGGFVSFVLMVFWSKLGLRTAEAYVLPVGAGILLLVQMFHDKIAPEARNSIRAATLLAMLGSAGYYALLDDSYPIGFHMTMLGVAVFAMAAGSFLRVRLYVVLGLAGLATDLAALLYKVLVGLDRSARMTIVGSQVLVFGALLIGGAVVYKTNQEKIDERIALLRERLGSWE